MAVEDLKKELFEEAKSAFLLMSDEEIKACYDYAEDYKTFLDEGKTERESVLCSVKMLEEAGFKKYEYGMKLSAGDRIYFNNRGKNIFAGA